MLRAAPPWSVFVYVYETIACSGPSCCFVCRPDPIRYDTIRDGCLMKCLQFRESALSGRFPKTSHTDAAQRFSFCSLCQFRHAIPTTRTVLLGPMLREYRSFGPYHNQSIGVNYVIYREGSSPGVSRTVVATEVLSSTSEFDFPIDGGRAQRAEEPPPAGLSHIVRRGGNQLWRWMVGQQRLFVCFRTRHFTAIKHSTWRGGKHLSRDFPS